MPIHLVCVNGVEVLADLTDDQRDAFVRVAWQFDQTDAVSMTVHRGYRDRPALVPPLWAVHVQGPDDVLAMASHEAAEKHAGDLNAWWVKHCAEFPDETGMRPNLRAVVIPWDGTPEHHAAELERLAREPAAT